MSASDNILGSAVATQVPAVRAWKLAAMATAVLLAAFAGIFSSLVAAVILGASFLLLLFGMPLPAAVLLLIVLIPFDLQRQVGPVRLYLDLAFAAALLPLVRWGWPSKRMWLFAPYVAFMVLSGIGRALNPFWFLAYCVRWMVALLFGAATGVSRVGESAVLVLGFTMVPLNLYGLYQILAGEFGPLFFFMNPHMAEQPWMDRAYSLFFHPNAYGNFCAVLTIMLLTLSSRGYRKGLCLILAALGILGLFASGSRGAILGAAWGMLMLLTLTKNFAKKGAILVPLAIGLVVAGLLAWMPLGRVGEIDEFTQDTRLAVMGAALVTFASNPLFGIGTTNFAEQLSSVIDWGFTNAHAHNIYLQVLAEEGIAGFALLFGPLFLLVRSGWKHRNDNLSLACVLGLAVFCIHGLVDVVWAYNPQSLLLFLAVVGLLAGRVEVLENVSRKSLHSLEA